MAAAPFFFGKLVSTLALVSVQLVPTRQTIACPSVIITTARSALAAGSRASRSFSSEILSHCPSFFIVSARLGAISSVW